MPVPRLVDTHCHLDDEQFETQRDDVVARAAVAGVEQILTIGVCSASSAHAVEIAAKYTSVYAAVGIQPNHVGEASPADWDDVVALVGRPKVMALGETGLDRYWDRVPFPLQQDYFDRHLRLSQAVGLPFIVHMRDCDADVLEMLREARQRAPLEGVMHSFTGTMETMVECVELGLYISFAGMVTYKKSEELRQIAKQVPADRMLIETDSPYLSPQPERGRRPNEPALVVHTARCLADTRGISFEHLAEITTENACRLFRLPRYQR